MMKIMFQKLIIAPTEDLGWNHGQRIIAAGGADVAQQCISEYIMGSICVYIAMWVSV